MPELLEENSNTDQNGSMKAEGGSHFIWSGEALVVSSPRWI